MGIFHPIGTGFLAGMAMSLMLGTVFFSIIQNSIRDNWKAGVKIALGVVICDLFFLFLVLAGDKYIQMLSEYKKEIALVGGVFLIALGLISIIKKPKEENHLFSTRKYVANGFLLNFLNPVNFAFWVTLSTLLGAEQNYDLNYKMLFFSFAVLAIFITESFISYGASKLKNLMTAHRLRILNIIVGLLFAGFGVKLIWDFIF
mgnify:CR=1 FL=1